MTNEQVWARWTGFRISSLEHNDKETERKNEMRTIEDFAPTLGNMIKGIDAIIITIPPSLRNEYAMLFHGTEIEELIFSTVAFEEAACKYCRESGWREPE